MQLLLVETIKRATPGPTSQAVDLAESTVRSLKNTSMVWLAGTNGTVCQLDEQLHAGVFSFVNTTTAVVNSTLARL